MSQNLKLKIKQVYMITYFIYRNDNTNDKELPNKKYISHYSLSIFFYSFIHLKDKSLNLLKKSTKN